MKFETAWVFYKSNRAIAKAAGVSDAAVSLWKKKGIVPVHAALRLESDSAKQVTMDPSVYTASAPVV